MAYDHRITPARRDLAASRLRGQVPADRYSDASPMSVAAPVANIWGEAGCLNLTSQALFGEIVDIYELRDGVAWGQLRTDGYVGYLSAAALTRAPQGEGKGATHRVSVPLSHLYPEPDVKRPTLSTLPMGALLRVTGDAGAFMETPQGWVPSGHLAPIDETADDPVTLAERFLDAPYLWGGRSALGLDCSALVQLAARACGVSAPRDSDMQEAALGTPVAPDRQPRRGDLVFWKGHVGLMQDGERILHANAHHMHVASEPLHEARSRIAEAGAGPVTGMRRL